MPRFSEKVKVKQLNIRIRNVLDVNDTAKIKWREAVA